MNCRIAGKKMIIHGTSNPIIVEKRSVQFRLQVDLLKRIEEDAMEEGRERKSGRAYNPSATVERILRAYYDAKPKRERRTK